jgi:hypothetical protein
MEPEDVPDPNVRDIYYQQASDHVSAGWSLRQALAVQQASPCDDELVAELIRAVLPLDELHQAMHEGDVIPAARWERCDQGFNRYKRILKELFRPEVAECLKMYEMLDEAVITELSTLLRERVRSCEESLLKHKVIADLEVTSERFLEQLLQDCEALKPSYEKFLERIRAQCERSCKVEVADMKASKRCMEKARRSYGSDYSSVVDIIRGSFVCTSERSLLAVVQRFLDATEEQSSQWQVVRCKNRFDPGDQAARDRGYRDLLVNLRNAPAGIVTEVQFHIQDFFDRQHKGSHHKKYELIR